MAIPLRLRRFVARAGDRLVTRATRKQFDAHITGMLKGLPADAVARARADRAYLQEAERFIRTRIPAWRHFNPKWHILYAAAAGRTDPAFMPVDLFYSWFEPRLNPGHRIGAFDKHALSCMPFADACPEVVARVVEGRPMAADFTPQTIPELLERIRQESGRLVLKPSAGSFGGRGIMIDGAEVVAREFETKLADAARRRIVSNLIVQRELKQSPALAALNPTSLNTVRVATVRVASGVRVASAVLRIGRGGSSVDNFGQGGLAVGVRSDDRLADLAFCTDFSTTTRHPETGVVFAEHHVPGLNRVVADCVDYHNFVPHMDVVSWDVTLDPSNRTRLIEFNLKHAGINIHQLSNGPLFDRELYDEVLEYIRLKVAVPRRFQFRTLIKIAP